MNCNCILVGLGLAFAWASATAGEPVMAPLTPPVPVEGADEQWHYHEKWDKAQQQRPLVTPPRGAAPATECRPPIAAERGTVRPAPAPGRCPDHGVRVRT